MKNSKNRNHIILLLCNLVIFFALFIIGSELNFKVTFTVYMILFAAFAFTYVFYNRGFSRKKITPDMLPDSWSYAEKTEFIEDGKRRLEKSKWMLTFLLPLIAIAGYLMIDLYVLPNILKLFS